MIEVNKEFLKPYLSGNRHTAYELTVDIADHLKFHIDGYSVNDIKPAKTKDNPYFVKLIDTRRPSESQHIKEYRRAIYLPVTKQPCFKVINSLKKIVKSPDWKIDFTKVKPNGKIRTGESLEDYLTKKFPFTGSIENWFYTIGLKEILSDPNGLICTLPISYELEDKTDFRKPYPYFVASEKVYDYKDGEYAVFESNTTYEYKSLDGKVSFKENVIMVVTKQAVYDVRKVNSNGDYKITEVLQLKFNRLPVRRGGGIYKCIIDNSVIFDSFLSPILPGLDAAARESSDLDAEVVQHIFTTMWYYAQQGCTSCAGTGRVIKEGKQSVCSKCEGNGVVAKSPYKDLVIKPTGLDEQSIKPPFAGYIEKNTEIVKIQDERIEAHIYKALSAINMEFLANTPLNQSGKAKEVDKDELNNFVYGVAYHGVEGILNPIIQDSNDIRLMDIDLAEDIRNELLPNIPVPERFEILSENYYQEQVINAKDKMDPIIVAGLEMDYVAKKFESMPDVRESFRVIRLIDPLPTLSDDEINNGIMNGTILKSDAIIHKYKNFFVKQAIFENEDFLEFPMDRQVSIIKKLATKKIEDLAKEQQYHDTIENSNMLNEINGGSIETPIDIEAEAKANLKGSVGGVQGLIQIQNSVAQGITDYESAVTMLFEIYGFDDKTARKLLGDKKSLEAKIKQKADDAKQRKIVNG